MSEGPWFLNHYVCVCGCTWDDEHDCTCNDHCPVCNKEIVPESSDEQCPVCKKFTCDGCEIPVDANNGKEACMFNPTYCKLKDDREMVVFSDNTDKETMHVFPMRELEGFDAESICCVEVPYSAIARTDRNRVAAYL